MRDPETTFGALVRELRFEHGLTAGALAERAGLSQSYITRLELGQVPPTSGAVSLLSETLLKPKDWSLYWAAGIVPPVIERAFEATPDLLLLVSRLSIRDRKALYNKLAPEFPRADPNTSPAWRTHRRALRRINRNLAD